MKIKHIITIISLFSLLMCQPIFSQIIIGGDANYELNIVGYMTRRSKGCGNIDGLRDVNVRSFTGRGAQQQWDVVWEGRKLHDNVSHKIEYTKRNKVSTVSLHLINRWENGIGTCDRGPDNEYINVDVNSTSFNWYRYNPGHGMLLTTINSRPVVSLDIPKRNGVPIAQTLSDEDYLTITLPDNLENRHFNWKYRIGTGLAKTIPVAYNNRNQLRIQGKDFLPDSAIDETITVWLEMGEDAGDKLAAGIAIKEEYLKGAAFCNDLRNINCRRGQTCNRTRTSDRQTCFQALVNDINTVFDGSLNNLSRYDIDNQRINSFAFRRNRDRLFDTCNNLPRGTVRRCNSAGRNCRNVPRSDEALERIKIECNARVQSFLDDPYAYAIYLRLIDNCNNLPRGTVRRCNSAGRNCRNVPQSDEELVRRRESCVSEGVMGVRNEIDNISISIIQKLSEINTNGTSKYKSFRSNTLTFEYKRSAPTIKEVVITPATCYDSNDAKVKVIFNRDLQPNEQIDALRLNEGSLNIANADPIRILEIEPSGDGWSYTYPQNIPNGSYVVDMNASLNGRATFTGSDGHRATVNMEPPSPVSYNSEPTVSNILCNGNEDGYAIIDVTGGTNNNYSYLLTESNNPWPTQEQDWKPLISREDTALIAELENSYNGSINEVCPNGSQGIGCRIGRGIFRQRFPTFEAYKQFVNPDRFMVLTTENLEAGTYKLKIRDGNGCVAKRQDNSSGTIVLREEIVKTVTINQPDPLEVTYNISNIQSPTAFGFTNGQIEAVISGGTIKDDQTYDLEWRNLSGINLPVEEIEKGVDGSGKPFYRVQLQNIPAGKYFLTVKDKNFSSATPTNAGCTVLNSEYTLEEPLKLEASIEITNNISCSSANSARANNENGIITVVIDGGVPFNDAVNKYEYLWEKKDGTQWEAFPNPNSDKSILKNIGQGEYRVRIRDANDIYFGATNTNRTGSIYLQETLIEPTPITITPTITHVNCNGEATGEIRLLLSGGIVNTGENYKIEWSGSASTSATRNNLIADSYRVEITDSNGCTAFSTIEIEEPLAPLEVQFASRVKEPSAPGFTDGFIEARVKGGLQLASANNYQFVWANRSGTNLNANVTQSYDPTTSEQVYLLNNIGQGDYQLTIVDEDTSTRQICSYTSPFETLTDPLALSLSIRKVQDISCNALNTSGNTFSDGILEIIAEGGNPPYRYEWKKKNDLGNWEILSNQTAVQATELGDGEYAANVIDKNGIRAGTYVNNTVTPIDATFVLIEPPLLNVTLKPTSILCKGASDGILEATISGGTPPYDVKWSNSVNTLNTSLLKHTISNLNPNNYEVTITDNRGCTITKQEEIQEPSSILEINVVDFKHPTFFNASNGFIKVEITGGTSNIDGSYNFNWIDANGTSINSNVTSSKASGTYTLLLEDIPFGKYELEVTDANYNSATSKGGCITSSNQELINPTPLQLEIRQTGEISCNLNNTTGGNYSDGELTAIASGGIPFASGQPYIFTWKKKNAAGVWEIFLGKTTSKLSDISSGEYSVNIEDANGIVLGTYVNNILVIPTDKTFVLQEPILLDIDTDVQNVFCKRGSDGKIEATILGGTGKFDIKWYPTSNPRLILKETLATTNRETFIENQFAGVYTIEVKDENGCTIQKDIEIKEPNNSLVIDTQISKDPQYHNATNGQIKVAVSGGSSNTDGSYRYQWLNSDGVMRNQGSGIAVSGSYEITLDGLSFGKYELVVEDANFNNATTKSGCTVQQSFDLQNPLPLTLSIEEINPISCHQDNIEGDKSSNGVLKAIAGGGVPITSGGLPYVFTWSKKNSVTGEWEELTNQTTETASGLDNGEYAVNIKDANNVVFGTYINNTLVMPTPVSYDLQEPDLLTLSINKQDVFCHNGSDGFVKATISGGIAPYTITWSTGKTETITANTTEIIDLPKGDYTIRVVDNRGCELEQVIPVAEPLNGLDINTLISRDPLRTNATNGQIKVSISGGSSNADGSYRYQWLDKDGVMANQGSAIVVSGSYEVTLNGLSSGTYELTVEDANFDSAVTNAGCTIQKSFDLQNPLPLTLGIEETNPISCHQDNIYGDESSDGELKAVAGGGVPFASGSLPYVFTWSKQNSITGVWEVLQDQITETASGLDNGVYAVNIEDANGIVLGTYVNNELVTPTPKLYDLQQPELLALSTNKQDVYCHGGSDGFVKATITGGTAPYTITWSTGKTETLNTNTTEIIDLSKGDYTIRVIDDRGCQLQQVISVTEPTAPLEVSFTDYGRVGDFGGSDGFIEATIKGGTSFEDGSYNFEWENASGLSLASQVISSASSTGEFVLLLKDIPADSYNLTVTDANYIRATNKEGCSITESEFILYEPIVVDIRIEKEITCHSSNPEEQAYADAILKAEVKGGAPFETGNPYQYIWKKKNSVGVYEVLTAQIEESAIDLGAGDYALNVVDRLGTVSGTYDGDLLLTVQDTFVSIEEPPLLEITNIDFTKVSCTFGNDATATAIIEGGIPPYTILWDNTDGDTTPMADNLTPGDFIITVQDARGCSVAGSVTIPPRDNTEQVELEHVNITCEDYSDGQFTVQVIDGEGPYTFGWRHAGTGLETSGLQAGSYQSKITYEDENTTFASPEEGYETTTLYEPSTATIQLTGLIPGIYELNATDVNQCRISRTYRILPVTDPLAVVVTTNVKQPSAPDFTDAFIEARVSGGNPLSNSYKYQWIRKEDGVNVSSNVKEVYDTTTNELVLTLEGVGEGTYELEVNDYPIAPHVNADGCFANISFELRDPLPLQLSVEQTAFITCNNQNTSQNTFNNGELTATVKGGVPFTTGLPYKFIWKKKDANGIWKILPEQTTAVASNLDFGEYAVNVEDANNITIGTYINNLLVQAEDILFLVNQPPLLEVSLSKRDVYCNDGNDAWVKAVISGGTPPYNVIWNTGKEIQSTVNLTHEITELVQGNYEVIITDSLGCNIIKIIEVNEPEPLNFAYTNFDRPSVYGASDAFIEMTVSGGTRLANNTYHYRWVNSANEDLNPQVTARFNTAGDYIIRLNNIPADTYKLTVEDNNFDSAIAKEGCTFIDSEFTLNEPLTAEISIEKEISCNANNEHLNPANDGVLKADVKGGVPFTSGQAYDVVWKKKNPRTGVWEILSDQQSLIASNVGTGEYAFNATDQFGTVIGNYRQDRLIEITDQTFIFNAPDLLEVKVTTTEVDCTIGNDASATAIITGGIPPYTIEWSTGATTPNISDLEPGRYFVAIEDDRGCVAENSFTIESPKRLRLKLVAKNNPDCHNGVQGSIEVEVKGGVPPYTYEWDNGILGPQITGLTEGSYTVKVTDSNLKNGRCAYQETFELISPELIPINLGDDRTLCTGQALDLDISINDPNATYLWESPNGFRSTDALVNLTDAGVYTATITNGSGCEVNDTIEVKYRDQLIEAEFLVATTAHTNKEIALVNVSSPRPEKIDWHLPEGVEVVTQDNDLVTLIFKEAGNYNLGLRAFQGDCYADYTKQIFVEEGQVSAADFVEEGDFIKDVIVFPNPNNGVFKVKIDLKREASAELKLMSLINGEVMDKIVTTPKKEHLVDYNVTLSSGTYVLIVETKFGNAIRKVIIN